MIKTNIRFENINPNTARRYLAKSLPNNRPISQHAVELYALDMQMGRWLATHQGIAFDGGDHLLDGQHRLHAVIKSNATVTMLVTRGLAVRADDDENGLGVFDVMDRGRARSVGQLLHLYHGAKSGSRMAACCRLIVNMCCGAEETITVPMALEVLKHYRPGLEAIISFSESATSKLLKASSVAAPLAFAWAVRREQAEAFAIQVYRGERLVSDDPAYVLRKSVDSHLDRPSIRGLSYRMKTAQETAHAFKAFVEGRKIKKFPPKTQGMAWLVDLQQDTVQKIIQATGWNPKNGTKD